MGLLSDIQDAAVDGSSDLETLLRKCRVLATKLNHEDLKRWVACELDGYPDGIPVPDYRKCYGQAFGHFFGALGRGVNNCPIQMSDIPDRYRDDMSHRAFREGVGELKNIVDTVEGSTVQFGWPAEAAHIVRPSNLAPDLVLAQGWLNIGKSQIVGILSTVRNRILGFALELEASYPDTAKAVPGETPLSTEEVNRVFNQQITQNFHGPVTNVASGDHIQQSGIINIRQGDFSSLAKFLEEKDVSEEDVLELEAAIKSDPHPKPNSKTFGTKVAAWIGKMIAKAAAGVWKVGSEAGAKILVEAIKTHYGMHS